MSFRSFLTPFNTAILSFSLLLLFNVIWMFVFGNAMGGQPVASFEIDWSRDEEAATFMPDFSKNNQFVKNGYNNIANNQSQAHLPRITASGNSKIIHLPNKMVEALPSNFASTGKLPRAPIEAVVQFTKFGKLPKIGILGHKPSEVYARPTPEFDGRPRIAILITGLGIHHQATIDAIDKLPGEISFGFSPYGNGLQDWINRARNKGHEIILQTPMEPFDFPDNDPGPSTLLADGDPSLNMNRLKWVLARITGYIGITNFMGAKFTAKEQAITPILKEINKRGLYFIENGILNRSKAKKISNEINLGYSNVDVIIDEHKSIEFIENSLESIEKKAARTGMAFAIGSNLPATTKLIRNWANGLAAKGYQLVPVSAKVKHQIQANLENNPN